MTVAVLTLEVSEWCVEPVLTTPHGTLRAYFETTGRLNWISSCCGAHLTNDAVQSCVKCDTTVPAGNRIEHEYCEIFESGCTVTLADWLCEVMDPLSALVFADKFRAALIRVYERFKPYYDLEPPTIEAEKAVWAAMVLAGASYREEFAVLTPAV